MANLPSHLFSKILVDLVIKVPNDLFSCLLVCREWKNILSKEESWRQRIPDVYTNYKFHESISLYRCLAYHLLPVETGVYKTFLQAKQIQALKVVLSHTGGNPIVTMDRLNRRLIIDGYDSYDCHIHASIEAYYTENESYSLFNGKNLERLSMRLESLDMMSYPETQLECVMIKIRFLSPTSGEFTLVEYAGAVIEMRNTFFVVEEEDVFRAHTVVEEVFNTTTEEYEKLQETMPKRFCHEERVCSLAPSVNADHLLSAVFACKVPMNTIKINTVTKTLEIVRSTSSNSFCSRLHFEKGRLDLLENEEDGPDDEKIYNINCLTQIFRNLNYFIPENKCQRVYFLPYNPHYIHFFVDQVYYQIIITVKRFRDM
jgi:hypothetical protein